MTGSTFAALALATDPADRASLRRQPDRKAAPLITTQMWLMILSQAVYQTVVALVLHFAGAAIFNYNSTDPGTAIDNDNELKCVLRSLFLLCHSYFATNKPLMCPTIELWFSIRLYSVKFVSSHILSSTAADKTDLNVFDIIFSQSAQVRSCS